MTMKNTLKIAIQQPCSEKFDSFKKTKSGGFCKSCSKNVIDFTKKTDKEVLDYFKTKPENTCGHFYKSQLKSYSEPRNFHELKKHSWLSALGLTCISLFSSNTLIAQTNKVDTIFKEPIRRIPIKNILAANIDLKGTIHSHDDNLPLPGASIILKNSVIGTESDFDGNFHLKDVKEGDIVSFYALGYETQEIIIKKNQSKISIMMKEDTNVLGGLITVGKVDVKSTYKTKRTFIQRIKSIF